MVFNIESSPPLLCSESLGHISGFENGGEMLAQGCPWDLCHQLSYQPRPTAPFQSMITKNVPCDQQKRKKTLAMEMSWLFIFMAEVLPIQWFNSHTHLCSVTQGVQTSFLSLS